MDLPISRFNIPEMETPSIYDEGEHPSEILKSIDNKLDNQYEIIENQKIQIAELKHQNEKLQQQIDLAENEIKQASFVAAKSKRESKVSIVIAILSIIADIVIAIISFLL